MRRNEVDPFTGLATLVIILKHQPFDSSAAADSLWLTIRLGL
jgi:hypothetical protein